jgi:hypothetical protein
MWQLFQNYCKCAIDATTMLQLVYDVRTWNHATCPHIHCPLQDIFITNFWLWFTLIQLIGPLMHYYWTTNV